MASISVIAVLTNIGRSAIANMTIGGGGFEVNEFVVGNGGVDPNDPATVLTPDPTATSLPSQTYGPALLVVPTPGYTGTLVTPYCPQFIGLLDATDANGAISNVGLVATFTDGPMVGQQILFALGNRPQIIKTDGDQIQITITLQT